MTCGSTFLALTPVSTPDPHIQLPAQHLHWGVEQGRIPVLIPAQAPTAPNAYSCAGQRASHTWHVADVQYMCAARINT